MIQRAHDDIRSSQFPLWLPFPDFVLAGMARRPGSSWHGTRAIMKCVRHQLKTKRPLFLRYVENASLASR